MDKSAFKKIRALFLDFDGVITDNKVLTDGDGKESVVCDRSDSLGMDMLKKAGIAIAVISKERNKVVSARCKKLGIECIQGIDNKISAFKEELVKRNLRAENTAFMGNDVNDIECIKAAGIGIAVNNSHPAALKAADYITSRNGGDGAVREVAELILGISE